MDWGFVWLMFVLKIPLIALLWIVWWSIRAQPEEADDERIDEGGGGGHHPRLPRPRSPRRGPHDLPVPSSPGRVRAVGRRRVPARR